MAIGDTADYQSASGDRLWQHLQGVHPYAPATVKRRKVRVASPQRPPARAHDICLDKVPGAAKIQAFWFMKTFCLRTKLGVTVTVALLTSLGASAQIGGPGSPAGVNAALTRLFGDISAFTAKAEVRTVDAAGKEVANMPMDFALLDKKVRIEIDMTKAKNNQMPSGMADSLKKMGLAQVVSIIRPDKKVLYVMYPDQKALLTMPLPRGETEPETNGPKINKTALGKEVFDGHPCIKNKVVFRDDKGQTLEATTWNASDLKDFPLQIETQENGNTSFMHFKQVQLARPPAAQFEPPTGYTQYSDPQEMMQAMMKRMMGGAQK